MFTFITFFISLLLLFETTILAEHNPLKGLSGPSFTEPSQILEMSEEWKKQSIKYDLSAGNVDIVVALDQHLYPALLPFIQKYAKEHNMKINVDEGTCGISSGLLSRKNADIGGYCCPPGLMDRLPGLQFHTLGISALTLLVHPANPINNVTIDQARQIFAGEIYRWSELRLSLA